MAKGSKRADVCKVKEEDRLFVWKLTNSWCVRVSIINFVIIGLNNKKYINMKKWELNYNWMI